MVHIEEIHDIDFDELCSKVMRQTNYDKDTAKDKLLEFEGNLTDVIRDYLRPPPKPVEKPKSLNQRIYREIRRFMDTTRG